MRGYLIVLGIILFFILWAKIERKLLVLTSYRVVAKKLPKQFSGTSFVVLADLHNNNFGGMNKRLIKKIHKLSPDFILAAGDIINKKEPAYPSNGFYLLEQLAKDFTIYYAYGNHEQKLERLPNLYADSEDKSWESLYSTWIEYKERLKKTGVKFLDNESTVLERQGEKMYITGISIGPEYFSMNIAQMMPVSYINKLIGICQEEGYQILIAHNPVFFKQYAAWGADLSISGHLHGGMVRLPGIGGIISPQAKLFPKYHCGKFTEESHEMIVSRGLGSHSVMPRLFNIPELVYVTLEAE